MDYLDHIYIKTSDGEDVTRHTSSLTSRTLRMVLVQVDGKSSVRELGEKLGDTRMVQKAIEHLLKEGCIRESMPDDMAAFHGLSLGKHDVSTEVSVKNTEAQAVSVMSHDRRAHPERSEENPAEQREGEEEKFSGFSSFGGDTIFPYLNQTQSQQDASHGLTDFPASVVPDPFSSPSQQDERDEQRESAQEGILKNAPSDSPAIEEVDAKTTISIVSERTENLPKSAPVTVSVEKSTEENTPRALPETLSNPPSVSQPAPSSLARHIFLGGSALVPLFLLVFLFFPYDSFRDYFERSLQSALRVPVRIGSAEIDFKPAPYLKFSAVLIGGDKNNQAIKVDEIHLSAPWVLLLGGIREKMQTLTISGAQIYSSQLFSLNAFLRHPDGDNSHGSRISTIALENITVQTDNLVWPPFFGQVQFKPNGAITQIALHTEDSKFTLLLNSSQEGFVFTAHSKDWRPAGLPFSFLNLNAEGHLLYDRLLVKPLRADLLGGEIQGHYGFFWNDQGLRMEGDGQLQSLDLSEISHSFPVTPPMQGQLQGSFKLYSGESEPEKSWLNLWKNMTLELDTKVSRVRVKGIDLSRATREDVLHQPSDESFLDDFQLKAAWKNSLFEAALPKLSMGMVRAKGQFSLDSAGNVRGRFQISPDELSAQGGSTLSLDGMFSALRTQVKTPKSESESAKADKARR